MLAGVIRDQSSVSICVLMEKIVNINELFWLCFITFTVEYVILRCSKQYKQKSLVYYIRLKWNIWLKFSAEA